MKAKYQYRDVWVQDYLKRFWLHERSTGRNYIMLNWSSVAKAKEFYDSWGDDV